MPSIVFRDDPRQAFEVLSNDFVCVCVRACDHSACLASKFSNCIFWCVALPDYLSEMFIGAYMEQSFSLASCNLLLSMYHHSFHHVDTCLCYNPATKSPV